RADAIVPAVLAPLRGVPSHPLRAARYAPVALRSAKGLAARFRDDPARALVAGVSAHAMLPLDKLPTGAFGALLATLAHAVGWPLSGRVPWRDDVCRRAGTVHVGGTFEQVAGAEAEVAAGRHPDRPFVLCVQPTVVDPSRAPAGRHVLWAYCHVPAGSTVDMTQAIESQIERFAPGFRHL